jgi:Protein of unknown function (DUF3617)
MSKLLLSCCLLLTGLAAIAAGMTLKPGLWEIKMVKQVMDGRDMSAQMAAAAANMQQAMANMTPEQRAKMQAMLPSTAGLGSGGGYRICVTPEMAKRNTPVIDKDGRCQPATVNHSGNVTTYEFSCNSNGSSRQGKGQVTMDGDVLTNVADMTSTTANGATHVMHSETEMHYLGADCGDVKPIEPPKQQP